MKAAEIGKCPGCGKVPNHETRIQFWNVKVQDYLMDLQACQEMVGLTQFMGGNFALGEAFSPDVEVAKTTDDLKSEFNICMTCYSSKPLAQLVECFTERQEEKEAAEVE